MGMAEILKIEEELADYEHLLLTAVQVRQKFWVDNAMGGPGGSHRESPEINTAIEAMAILEKDLTAKKDAINEKGYYAVDFNMHLRESMQFSIATPRADTAMGGTVYRRLPWNSGYVDWKFAEVEDALNMAMSLNVGVFARKEMARERQNRH